MPDELDKAVDALVLDFAQKGMPLSVVVTRVRARLAVIEESGDIINLLAAEVRTALRSTAIQVGSRVVVTGDDFSGYRGTVIKVWAGPPESPAEYVVRLSTGVLVRLPPSALSLIT